MARLLAEDAGRCFVVNSPGGLDDEESVAPPGEWESTTQQDVGTKTRLAGLEWLNQEL